MGGWEHSCLEPSATRPRTSIAPQKAKRQNHAQNFPLSICPSAGHANRSPSSLKCALVDFREAILSQQLPPSGYRVTSLYGLQRIRSLWLRIPIVQLQASLTCLCLAWRVLATPSALLSFFPGTPPGRQTLWFPPWPSA